MSDIAIFAGHEPLVQRQVVIGSASLSIAAGIAVLFWWFAMPLWYQYQDRRQYEKGLPSLNNQEMLARPRRPWRIKQFRHDLTIALIIMDLIKAIVLICYPIRYLHFDSIQHEEQFQTFCDVIGFLTVAIMQASDFAVLALAIHTALLIFYPSFTGGLYRFRFIIYSIFFIVLPLVFASIGLIGNSGYTFFSSWCYVVINPLWYSLVLALIPRLIMMVLIICIYFSIFIYVKVHMYQVSKAIIQASAHKQDSDEIPDEYLGYHARAILRMKRIYHAPRRGLHKLWRDTRMVLSYFPGFGSLNPLLGRGAAPASIQSQNSDAPTLTLHTDFQTQMNRENIIEFNRRRSIIDRQVNSTLIYPITYVLLYIFPIIQMCLHYTQHRRDPTISSKVNTVYWLAIIASWMKPFNCFVDTCVFVVREGAIPCLAKRKSLHRPVENQPDFVRGPSGQPPDEAYRRAAEIDYVIPPRTGERGNSWVSQAYHAVTHLFHCEHPKDGSDLTQAAPEAPNVAPLPSAVTMSEHNASQTPSAPKLTAADSNSTCRSDPSHRPKRAGPPSLDWTGVPLPNLFEPNEQDITEASLPEERPASPKPEVNPPQTPPHSPTLRQLTPAASPELHKRDKRASTMPASSNAAHHHKHHSRVSSFHNIMSSVVHGGVTSEHSPQEHRWPHPHPRGRHNRHSCESTGDPSHPINDNENNDRDEHNDPSAEMGLKEFLESMN